MFAELEPVAFVATAQPERARTFYAGVLGLRLVEDTPFALVFAAGSTHLRVSIVKQFTPATFTVLGWQVDDIRAAIAYLVQRGAKFERFAGMPQDADGVWKAPGGHQVAWFKDPDGNLLSVTQIN